MPKWQSRPDQESRLLPDIWRIDTNPALPLPRSDCVEATGIIDSRPCSNKAMWPVA
jgi:hypothetical protein